MGNVTIKGGGVSTLVVYGSWYRRGINPLVEVYDYKGQIEVKTDG